MFNSFGLSQVWWLAAPEAAGSNNIFLQDTGHTRWCHAVQGARCTYHWGKEWGLDPAREIIFKVVDLEHLFLCCMYYCPTHNPSSGAVEALRAKGGWALGVSGQTLRTEKTWGAHHDAQHGFLTSGHITAVVALQAQRTLQRAFILHTREREGRFRAKLNLSSSMGEWQSKIKIKNPRESWIELRRCWKNTDIASLSWPKDELRSDFICSSC